MEMRVYLRELGMDKRTDKLNLKLFSSLLESAKMNTLRRRMKE